MISLLSGMWSVAILVGPLAGGVFARYGHWRGCVRHGRGHRRRAGARRLPRAARRRAPRRPSAPPFPACGSPWSARRSPAPRRPRSWRSPVAKALLIALAVAFLAAMLRLDRKAAAPLLPSDAFAAHDADRARPVAAAAGRRRLQPAADLHPDLPAEPARPRSADRRLRRRLRLARLDGGRAAGRRRARGLARPLHRARPAHHGGVARRRRACWPTSARCCCALAILGIGVGIGICWAFVAQRIMSGARKGEEAVAAASVPTVQQMGFALGAALSGLAANSAGFAVGLPHEAMAHVAFVVPVCFAVSAALGCVLWRCGSTPFARCSGASLRSASRTAHEHERTGVRAGPRRLYCAPSTGRRRGRCSGRSHLRPCRCSGRSRAC